ncbi:MAG TPA: transporter substrate-binding domain-containing protein [Thermoanaerobaculia bacterium]|nr:transporter substrate-binding domain-containing protein [Thermoanaerobaculia bacterium]
MTIRSRLHPWLTIAALALGIPSVCSEAQTPAPAPAPTKTAGKLSTQIQSWSGDLDGMLERRMIRALVPFSKTLYFVVNGAQRGAAYDNMKAFEAYVNQKFPPKRKNLKLHVVFVPASRGDLLPDLVAGRGDIAIAALTITPERRKVVDFSNSTVSGVHEIVVTGPSSPEISNVDDLSGKEVFVRKSSSYWGSLDALNARFQKEGKAPVLLRPAPEDLEDEDLLEMVNAGVVPIVVVDAWLPKAWGKVYTKIRAHTDVVLSGDGEFGWAMRKNSPKLMALVNDFVRTHRQGTTFGNTIIKKYTQNTAALQNSTSADARKRFDQIVQYFQKYSDRYHMDYLLMAAQGFQESRLDQNAKSHVGAIGVMQLMPATGKDMNVGDIHQTEANIHAGVKYIRFMVDQYYAKEPMDDRNKVLFAFASYNAGAGRIQSLRRLASQRGLDPNVWIGNVEVVVAEKIGMETVTYVDNIYKYYVAYKLLTEQAAEKAKAKAAVAPAK